MRSLGSWFIAGGVLAAACGDNSATAVDATQAAPDAAPECLASAPFPGGLLGTPDDLPPLDGCVPWTTLEPTTYFVQPTEFGNFDYGYPSVAYACEAGFQTPTYGDLYFDATRGFARQYIPFDGGEYADATAYCLRADGTLALSTQTCFTFDGATECYGEFAANGPTHPMLGEVARNVTLVASDTLPSNALDVDIKGDVAYVAGYYGVRTYDLSDPATMPMLGELELPDTNNYINDIEVVELGGHRIAFVASETTLILDVTDPTTIINLGAIDISGRDPYAHTVQIGTRGAQTLLFLGGQAGVPVYDVSTPTAPLYLTTLPLDGNSTHDLTVDGDHVYVNNGFSNFVAIDASDLEAPVELARFPSTFYDHASAAGDVAGQHLVIHGGEGLEAPGVAAHLRVFDGEPTSPTYMDVIGEFATRASTGIHNMVLADGYAYVAYYQDGLRIIDLHDPTNPVEVAHYNSWDRDGSLERGGFAGAIGLDLAADGSVVLLNYEGQVMRLRPTLP